MFMRGLVIDIRVLCCWKFFLMKNQLFVEVAVNDFSFWILKKWAVGD